MLLTWTSKSGNLTANDYFTLAVYCDLLLQPIRRTMKTIGLKQAFNRLKESAAVIVDNDALVYPSLDDITNTPENEFLFLSWEVEGKEYRVKCIEKNNQTVKVSDDGSTMLLEDEEGDKIELTLLQPANYSTKNFEEEVKLNCCRL